MSNKTNQKDLIYLNIVKGNEGYCLNLVDNSGNGERILGCKPWGNPFNKPIYSFKLNKDELTRLRNYFNIIIEEMN